MTEGRESSELPSDSAILEFIDGCETPPSVKEVARAFSLPDARASLRQRLKAAADGRIARQRGAVGPRRTSCPKSPS